MTAWRQGSQSVDRRRRRWNSDRSPTDSTETVSRQYGGGGIRGPFSWAPDNLLPCILLPPTITTTMSIVILINRVDRLVPMSAETSTTKAHKLWD